MTAANGNANVKNFDFPVGKVTLDPALYETGYMFAVHRETR